MQKYISKFFGLPVLFKLFQLYYFGKIRIGDLKILLNVSSILVLQISNVPVGYSENLVRLLKDSITGIAERSGAKVLDVKSDVNKEESASVCFKTINIQMIYLRTV